MRTAVFLCLCLACASLGRRIQLAEGEKSEKAGGNGPVPHSLPKLNPLKGVTLPPAFDPSVEDLERSAGRARDWILRVVKRVRSVLGGHRHVALFLGGALGLLHGGTFAFTVLFLQAFGKSGWPLVQGGLQRGMAAYTEAKAQQGKGKGSDRAKLLRQELDGLASELAKLRREGASQKAQQSVIQQMREVRQKLEELPPSERAAPILLAALEPSVVRDVVLGIWSGVTVSLTTACSSAARTVGIGMSLGEFVSKAAVTVLSKTELFLRRLLSQLPSEAVMLTYLGPSLLGSATLNLVGRAVGCWLAYRLQQLAAVLSVSLLAADMLLESMGVKADEESEEEEEEEGGAASQLLGEGAMISLRRRDAVAWILALASLVNQRSRNFHLPFFLTVPLLPALGIEALLRKLAQRLTEKGYP